MFELLTKVQVYRHGRGVIVGRLNTERPRYDVLLDKDKRLKLNLEPDDFRFLAGPAPEVRAKIVGCIDAAA